MISMNPLSETLACSAIVLENRWQQGELQKANENLEQLVEERTAEVILIVKNNWVWHTNLVNRYVGISSDNGMAWL